MLSAQCVLQEQQYVGARSASAAAAARRVHQNLRTLPTGTRKLTCCSLSINFMFGTGGLGTAEAHPRAEEKRSRN